MKNLNISIEDELFIEIDKRTTPDFDHGDVVQKLLKKALISSQPTTLPRPRPDSPPIPPSKDSIASFVQTPQYKVRSGIDKYLAVLAWVNKNKPEEFQRIEDYRRGNRVYFGRTQRQVEDSGEGIKASQIPGSTVWALTTLDNRTKRKLLADVLYIFNFQPGEIDTVVNTIPDSDKHRSSNIYLELAEQLRGDKTPT